MLFETTELAPMMLPRPMVTPASTDTNSPIQTLSSMTIFLATAGSLWKNVSAGSLEWPTEAKTTWAAQQQPGPISRGP